MKASDLPKGRLIKMSGVGSFKYKFNAGIHKTGELHTLHDNEKAVEKLGQIVSAQKKYIRNRGLSVYQIRKDVNEIKSADENLTFNDKKFVKKIFKNMGTEAYKALRAEENKKPEPEPIAPRHPSFIYKNHTSASASINRNPSAPEGAPVLNRPLNINANPNNQKTATSISQLMKKPFGPANLPTKPIGGGRIGNFRLPN